MNNFQPLANKIVILQIQICSMKKTFLGIVFTMIMITGCSANQGDTVNNGIRAGGIISSINKGKAVLIKDKIITDDLDFSKIKRHDVFSSSIEIARVDVPVTFLNCIFMGKVITNGMQSQRQVNTQFGSSVTFEACDFRGDADFSNSTVDGMVNFTGAIFREKALFNNVTLKGRQVYFTAFTSEKLFSMQESRIEGAIDFFKAKITGKVSFQSTDFWGTARFSDLDCNGKSDFSLTNFRSDALFTYTNFGNEFRMSNATVAGRLDLISVTFQSSAWLTNSVFAGKVNLTKSEVKARFDLSGSLFAAGRPVTDEFVVQPSGELVTTGAQFATFQDYTNE